MSLYGVLLESYIIIFYLLYPQPGKAIYVHMLNHIHAFLNHAIID